MSAPPPFQVGEPFDPREAQTSKLYPVDWVNGSQDLNDGPKRVYCYLYGIAVKSNRAESPWHGFVYPTVDEIAKNLGKSSPSVRRDLAVLQAQKYLKVDRPNKRECNRYYFLWKKEFERLWRAIFERSNVSAQDRNDERSRLESSALESEHPERSNVSAPYKEDSQLDSQGIPSSSSDRGGGDYTSDREQTDPEKRTKMVSFSPSSKTPEPPKTWYADAETQECAAEILQRSADSHRYRICRQLGPLEVSTLLCILPNMANLEDLQLWLDSSAGFLTMAESWGRFVTDSRKWPGRREETMALVARSVPVPETERERYASPAEPESVPVHSTPEPAPRAPLCPECGGFGIRTVSGMDEWCTCPAGAIRQARDPDMVNKSNDAARKLDRFRDVAKIDVATSNRPDHKGMQQACDVIPAALAATASG